MHSLIYLFLLFFSVFNHFGRALPLRSRSGFPLQLLALLLRRHSFQSFAHPYPVRKCKLWGFRYNPSRSELEHAQHWGYLLLQI